VSAPLFTYEEPALGFSGRWLGPLFGLRLPPLMMSYSALHTEKERHTHRDTHRQRHRQASREADRHNIALHMTQQTL
jgi:hypothetical protein